MPHYTNGIITLRVSIDKLRKKKAKQQQKKQVYCCCCVQERGFKSSFTENIENVVCTGISQLRGCAGDWIEVELHLKTIILDALKKDYFGGRTIPQIPVKLFNNELNVMETSP